MTDTPNRPPLWEAMQDAYFNSRISPRHGYAAEIRALRDWLVPEGQPEPKCKEPTYEWVQWNDRQHLRALLTAEADRAERGDD